MTLSAARFNRFWADTFTLFRFFAALLVWLGLSAPDSAGHWLAFLAFLAGAASDYLDGVLARLAGGHTAFGRIVDPLADKALTLAAFAGLAFQAMTGWWLFWVVAGRDLIVTVFRFCVHPEHSGARDSGKWKTLLQMAYLLSAMALLVGMNAPRPAWAEAFLVWGAWAIAALTLWSGLRFLTEPPKSVKA